MRTKTAIPIDPTAQVIYEALQQLGGSADSKRLADKIKQLEFGLPGEDEFSITVRERSHNFWGQVLNLDF